MVSFRVPIIKRIKNTAFYAVDKSNGDLIKTNLRYFFMRENISYRFSFSAFGNLSWDFVLFSV